MLTNNAKFWTFSENVKIQFFKWIFLGGPGDTNLKLLTINSPYISKYSEPEIKLEQRISNFWWFNSQGHPTECFSGISVRKTCKCLKFSVREMSYRAFLINAFCFRRDENDVLSTKISQLGFSERQ